MNTVGAAAERILRNNRANAISTYIGKVDKLNGSFDSFKQLEDSINKVKGVGAMNDLYRKSSVVPTLPSAFLKATRVQRGNLFLRVRIRFELFFNVLFYNFPDSLAISILPFILFVIHCIASLYILSVVSE
ncbi:hypothetical protein [uncultured Lactobacillus sp.]|uniref:hypothetical protein n=1 Tax=uncultured Lactobacillus sp. TaxID=153152 RepID=UPI0025882D68|nr:hypothetical protein [uncultured Lactobacillus sp.]